jgi:hypothetical protein
MPAHSRYWVRADPAPFDQEALAADDRERRYLEEHGHKGPLPPARLLAISGGGDDGAFGAGLLVGWTQAGTRPDFKVVTGISTGALAAPYAFLGSKYDDKLKEVFTTMSTKDIFRRRHIWAAVTSDAMCDTTPLSNVIAHYIDAETLGRIADEYRKGRVLLIGTANLDSRQGIIWDMGAIAASGQPKALDLFRAVLLASASAPAEFPPVMIDVDVDGRRYQEMHVDGGTVAQTFVYPTTFHLKHALGAHRERALYIIRNARLDPNWASVERRTITIASRAIGSLVESQGLGDLYRLYAVAQRDGVDYNLAYIPRDFADTGKEPFDPQYMGHLFERARRLAASGYPWEKAPPGYGEP